MLLLLLAGCAGLRRPQDEDVKAQTRTPQTSYRQVEKYVVHCPDVLEISIPNHPEECGRFAIGPDGRINLGETGLLRVEGETPEEIALALARQESMPVSLVRVGVAEYNGQQIYLFGAVLGQHRAVPYEGPETVVELLRRIGGITPEAAPSDVHVIRAHIMEGGAPEVFHINLKAILLKKDETTNIRLQPFDEVYVGETRQATVGRSLPHWLRPVYEAIIRVKLTH
jgi:protein involved in polysaccharide export with SLBB domain